ncbi:MAG: hypothetical protein OXH70_21250 [Acidobacteria bacterium]|nr:hypothetical protein [Acidobacteriota bacterium]
MAPGAPLDRLDRIALVVGGVALAVGLWFGGCGILALPILVAVFGWGWLRPPPAG